MINNLSDLLLPHDSKVVDAMRVIGSTAAQIALVIDTDKKLIGTITDGDIRRALLHGITLEAEVQIVMNKDFRYVSDDHNKYQVFEMMKTDFIRQVPVLDSNKRVIDILLLEELLDPPRLTSSVVIMAGGKGTRLRPYTANCPKPMLPVGGQPILQILIENCISSGFSKFYISVNYLREQIIDYFGDGSKWGVSIEYLIEDQPLGTAGALHLLKGKVIDPVLVINGDVLTRFDLTQLIHFHKDHKAQATLCVREHTSDIPYGVVKTDGVELVSFKEKPKYQYLVNAGVYVIDPSLFPLIPTDQLTDMPCLLKMAKKSGLRVVVCPIHEYWLDVGQPETLKQASATWHESHE